MVSLRSSCNINVSVFACLRKAAADLAQVNGWYVDLLNITLMFVLYLGLVPWLTFVVL